MQQALINHYFDGSLVAKQFITHDAIQLDNSEVILNK